METILSGLRHGMCPVAATIIYLYFYAGSLFAQADSSIVLRVTIPQTIAVIPSTFTQTLVRQIDRQQDLIDSLLLVELMLRRKVSQELQQARELELQGKVMQSAPGTTIRNQYELLSVRPRESRSIDLPVAILSVILQVTQLLKSYR